MNNIDPGLLSLGLTIILAIIGATAYQSRSMGILQAKMDTFAKSSNDLWIAFDEHRARDDTRHEALNGDLQQIRGSIGRLQGKMGNGTIPRRQV